MNKKLKGLSLLLASLLAVSVFSGCGVLNPPDNAGDTTTSGNEIVEDGVDVAISELRE